MTLHCTERKLPETPPFEEEETGLETRPTNEVLRDEEVRTTMGVEVEETTTSLHSLGVEDGDEAVVEEDVVEEGARVAGEDEAGIRGRMPMTKNMNLMQMWKCHLKRKTTFIFVKPALKNQRSSLAMQRRMKKRARKRILRHRFQRLFLQSLQHFPFQVFPPTMRTCHPVEFQ
jgi:hypothetical protein